MRIIAAPRDRRLERVGRHDPFLGLWLVRLTPRLARSRTATRALRRWTPTFEARNSCLNDALDESLVGHSGSTGFALHTPQQVGGHAERDGHRGWPTGEQLVHMGIELFIGHLVERVDKAVRDLHR